jgi:NADH-quinone oxidoreductase subunit N
VYQGAPAPVSAFVATVSKGAVFVLLLRYVGPIDLDSGGILLPIFSAVAYASMVAGNLLALLQDNVKRLLAYSSIAHLGYLLVALIAGGERAGIAVAFYLTVYSVTMVAAFGVVTALSRVGGEAESLEAYRGLGRTRPGLAAVFTVAVLSLAGIPVTAGFIGKFFIVQAGAGADRWGLLVTLGLTSAMSLYYYLRVVIVMFAKTPAQPVTDVEPGLASPGRYGGRLAAATLVALALLTIFLGVYPTPLLRLIEQVASLVG